MQNGSFHFKSLDYCIRLYYWIDSSISSNSFTNNHTESLSLHTGRPVNTLQMVSGLVKEQHTYAGYISAKSSTLRPGRGRKLCSQLTNIYREITHSTYNPATDGAEFLLTESRGGSEQRFCQQVCVCRMSPIGRVSRLGHQNLSNG